MVIYKKHFLNSLLSILLVLILFSGCAEFQDQTNDPSESITDNMSLVSYCAKEKSEENRIFFNYPQFKETVPDANKLNELIVGFVKNNLKILDGGFKGNLKDSPENWEWDEDEYTLQAMDISYKITRNDSDYFSVTFEGEFNHKKAAHPTHYFNSLIIDVNNCKIISLSNLYTVDEKFLNHIEKIFNDQIRAGLTEQTETPLKDIPVFVEEILSSLDHLESLRQADKSSDSGFHSYLTDTSLGISVPLIFAFGNHFEILIPYDELIEYT